MEYLGAVGKQRQDVLPAAEARFPRSAADVARTIFAGLDRWIRLTLTARRPVQEGISSMTARAKHCVLIVDDEPNVCDSVHDLLRREFRVLKAHSAEAGYELMQQEEVHIVMSDQRMPRISGVELLTKLKTRYPHAVRMLFTGFADLESVIAAINQGHVFQFVRKPWQPEELLLAVRQAAGEYDRLEMAALEREQLVEEIGGLKTRLSSLESEVRRLQGKTSDS